MPDLKAAAERLRERLNPSGAKYVMVRDERRALVMFVEAQDNLLAAQALEAWAWMAENGWRLENDGKDCWACTSDVFLQNDADTPLGAVLAAMEGERDA